MSAIGPSIRVVTDSTALSGVKPPTTPKLAMTPEITPTMKPLTCDPLNRGVASLAGVFAEVRLAPAPARTGLFLGVDLVVLDCAKVTSP